MENLITFSNILAKRQLLKVEVKTIDKLINFFMKINNMMRYKIVFLLEWEANNLIFKILKKFF